MLQPMRTKFRKAHKGRIKGIATSGVNLAFGQYALKALEPERVTARQIEAARRALTRHMKRAGQVWIRVYPGCSGVEKAARSSHGLRQGLGRNSGSARVKPGRIMFEVDGISERQLAQAKHSTLAAAKLPIKTRFVARIAA